LPTLGAAPRAAGGCAVPRGVGMNGPGGWAQSMLRCNPAKKCDILLGQEYLTSVCRLSDFQKIRAPRSRWCQSVNLGGGG